MDINIKNYITNSESEVWKPLVEAGVQTEGIFDSVKTDTGCVILFVVPKKVEIIT